MDGSVFPEATLDRVFYVVYQVTNIVNGRYYRGAHVTRDLADGYLGSGRLIIDAVSKYGRDAFRKDYLICSLDEEAMYAAEAALVVTVEKDPLSYNLTPGGSRPPHLPWSKEKREAYRRRRIQRNQSQEHRALVSAAATGRLRPDLARRNREESSSFKRGGYRHSAGSLALMSAKKRGRAHPQHGSRWITDGDQNRKIRGGDPVPAGWHYGRAAKRTSEGRFT